ncbi:unnamed protein product [Miscanthus lutarioriparius]|uniref:Serine/threonine-protein kinase BSK1-like TPR repeats domain-containing protein n=1 Tax=Miscanthus lutarioriparius TaxID=422564 RepID=A0A811RFJ6_9POAL|nr:unnamed protein product [Miscanthus lutarioriparius]
MAPPIVCGIASALDGGKGRIREAVEAVWDGNGAGALHVAAAHGRTRVCAYLVEELQMDVNDTAVLSGDTPLTYAVRSKKNVDAVRYLLDHDADPNKRVHHGCTPLSIAVGKGICVMVELLLSKGADVNSLSCGGTPLHVAATENHGAVMKILLDYNADDHPVYKMDLADLKLEGSKAYNKKDYSTAVKLYSVAIMKSDSGDATLLSNRSLCFIKMGEGDKALVDAEACRALQPYWPKARFRQGIAHMLLKRGFELLEDISCDMTTKLSELSLAHSHKNIMQDLHGSPA